MSLEQIKNLIPDYAKDIRVNLGNVLTEEGAPGLTRQQIFSIALTCAYTLGNKKIIGAILDEAKDSLGDMQVNAAKSASSIMAMNNIYYRFLHLSKDPELGKLPARLRMTVIGNPGVEKSLYEANCLAASILTGCENCIKSHIAEVKKGGINLEGVQSIGRIAAVLNATNQAIKE